MICLTSDLCHASLGSGNQRHCGLEKIQVARRYLRLLGEAGVKVTFFASGRAVANEARGAVSTMIVHPITMYLCDRFAGIRRILEFVSCPRRST